MGRDVRQATMADVPQIMAMIAHSRGVMRMNGNTSQWVGYPGEVEIGQDIEAGIGRMIEDDGNAVGYFAMLTTPEPTYACIYDGLWLDDTTPYTTLHRLACVDGVSGIAACAFEWCESRSATVRADTHMDNKIMLHIMEKRGYVRCGVVLMDDGSPREAYQKMMYPQVDADLKSYVESEILPRYGQFDRAHDENHVKRVMAQSMELSGHYQELNSNMVYAAAAYHDTGLTVGRERHHLESGRIVRADKRLMQWFDGQEIERIAQAVEDHRASASSEPRSLYGRIVAEADRDIEPKAIVRRTVEYGLDHYPELDEEGHWMRAKQHLNEKYGEGGYMKLYVAESRNGARLAELREMIADEARLRSMFNQIMEEKWKQC